MRHIVAFYNFSVYATALVINTVFKSKLYLNGMEERIGMITRR